jgi:hypothetical protein
MPFVRASSATACTAAASCRSRSACASASACTSAACAAACARCSSHNSRFGQSITQYETARSKSGERLSQVNVHVPTPTSSAPERCIVRASSGASMALSWPSTLIEALKCSGPSVTLDQRNASTDGSSTSSVRLKLSDGLRRLPSLRRVRPPSLPARKDSRVFAWLNSGLGGGSSALLGVLLLAATAAMTVC